MKKEEKKNTTTSKDFCRQQHSSDSFDHLLDSGSSHTVVLNRKLLSKEYTLSPCRSCRFKRFESTIFKALNRISLYMLGYAINGFRHSLPVNLRTASHQIGIK